jgi:hypothetical protein
LDDEPQSAVAIYIYRVGRSCPIRKYFYKLNLSGLLNLARNQGDTGQTGAPGVYILEKSYLTHPDSDLDVPYMDFDLLDETYPMVKSK